MKTIGVFDSGVGGLSVLRALLAEIPEAQFFYVADSAFAPYGERSAQAVVDRSQRMAAYLLQHHTVDALVVACNTATAMAVDELRRMYPHLPIVGVEPALKTAASLSRTGHIGVLATRGTLDSERFAQLRGRVEASTPRIHFSCQPCDGLADAIERADPSTTQLLCERYLQAVQALKEPAQPIDTLVLGCTHYPFAAPVLSELCGPGVALVETGLPVARRTRAVLGLDATGHRSADAAAGLRLFSTGDPAALTLAAQRWLCTSASASHLVC
ncbi:glutamate racemase [Hydrogenophaga sp.]|uniref:glutamate racemase n=1 Tax=Hydrogenophaga sp. TaxID=1904254 RepID=UPI003F6B8326